MTSGQVSLLKMPGLKVLKYLVRLDLAALEPQSHADWCLSQAIAKQTRQVGGQVTDRGQGASVSHFGRENLKKCVKIWRQNLNAHKWRQN